jgi:hypothetical protein
MDDLKYFALTYIDLQDNLTIQEKNELAKFVVGANEDQVAYLLCEGEMVEKFDPNSWQQGQDYGQDVGLKMGATGGIAAAGVAAIVITTAFKAYKRFLSKAARGCSKFAGQAKTSCMIKYKRDALKAQIAKLNGGKAKCANTKDRANCVQKLDKKVQSVRAKLGTL